MQWEAGELSMAEQQSDAVCGQRLGDQATLGVNPRSAKCYLCNRGQYTKHVASCVSGWSSVKWRR